MIHYYQVFVMYLGHKFVCFGNNQKATQVPLPHTMLWRPLIPSGAGTMLLVSNDQLMPDQNAPDAKAGVFSGRYSNMFKRQSEVAGLLF